MYFSKTHYLPVDIYSLQMLYIINIVSVLTVLSGTQMQHNDPFNEPRDKPYQIKLPVIEYDTTVN